MTQPDIDPIDSLIKSAHKCEQALDQALRSVKSLPKLTMSYSKFRLLDYIARNPGCARVDIAAALGTSQSNYSNTIDQLIELNLVIEDVEPGNYARRKRFLRLHPNAVDVVSIARDKVYETKKSLLNDLSSGAAL